MVMRAFLALASDTGAPRATPPQGLDGNFEVVDGTRGRGKVQDVMKGATDVMYSVTS